VVSFAHFWIKKDWEENDKYSLSGRCCDLQEDLLRVLITPVGIVALELSAIFGIFSPYNGRKLYASCERLLYGDSILAPCFQPDATKHLFGVWFPGGQI
jgi:xanthosine utilization system XapX-like protein